MANAIYPKGLEGLLEDINFKDDTIKVAIGRGGSFNAAHSTLADLTGDGFTVVGTAATLATKTTTLGVADAADTVLGSPAAGPDLTALVIYKDGGTPATSRLLVWFDTGTGLPVTPDGGEITAQWDSGANKIFKI